MHCIRGLGHGWFFWENRENNQASQNAVFLWSSFLSLVSWRGRDNASCVRPLGTLVLARCVCARSCDCMRHSPTCPSTMTKQIIDHIVLDPDPHWPNFVDPDHNPDLNSINADPHD